MAIANVAGIAYEIEYANPMKGNAIQATVRSEPSGIITPMVAIRLSDVLGSILSSRNRPTISPDIANPKMSVPIRISNQTGLWSAEIIRRATAISTHMGKERRQQIGGRRSIESQSSQIIEP